MNNNCWIKKPCITPQISCPIKANNITTNNKPIMQKISIESDKYFGCNYTMKKTQNDVKHFTFDGDDMMVTQITETHVIHRNDIDVWLHFLFSNNIPFAFKKNINGEILYFKTNIEPLYFSNPLRITPYNFETGYPEIKNSKINMFEKNEFIQLDPLLLYLNKKDMAAFISTCSKINKYCVKFYKNRNWTCAPKYKRFKYMVEFRKNHSKGKFMCEKIGSNQFIINEVLTNFYGYGEGYYDFKFVDQIGNKIPCKYIK